jgi:hypothetical protein
LAQNSGIKLDRSIKIRDGDVCPAKCVRAHFDIVITNFLRSLR